MVMDASFTTSWAAFELRKHGRRCLSRVCWPTSCGTTLHSRRLVRIHVHSRCFRWCKPPSASRGWPTAGGSGCAAGPADRGAGSRHSHGGGQTAGRAAHLLSMFINSSFSSTCGVHMMKCTRMLLKEPEATQTAKVYTHMSTHTVYARRRNRSGRSTAS